MPAQSNSGWLLSLVELMMAEYHHTPRAAVWEFPICILLAILPARAQRLGLKLSGGDYLDKAGERARQKTRKWLRENFTILQPQPRT